MGTVRWKAAHFYICGFHVLHKYSGEKVGPLLRHLTHPPEKQ